MENELYRPAPQVLERLAEVDFVAVVGPSAVGKTTLIREAVKREPSLHLVLNNTSRYPRPDERAGIDYRFESRARMEERIMRHEYVQVAPSVFGDFYATAAEDYATEGVALLPILADAIPVFRVLPFKRFRTVFVVPPDWEAWQHRLEQHQFNTDKRLKRLVEGKRSWEFALKDSETKLVINDDLATAADDFIAILLEKPLSEHHQQDQVRAKDIVRNLLEQTGQVMHNLPS